MDRVLVHMDRYEEPKPLKHFLVDLADRGHPGLSLSQTQYKWWSNNGKTFRFLDLPQELRLKLLVHVLGTNIQPHTVTRSQLPEQVVLGSKRRNPDWNSRLSLEYPNYAIFGVSKQVHQEAKMGGNPWQERVDVNWGAPQFRNVQGQPCYRVIIDWILTFAYPYVKHIPKVHLQGHIKNVTKTKWDRIFLTEYLLGQGKEIGHHGFVYQSALDVISNEPAFALAPHCYCPKSCIKKYEWWPCGREVKDRERRRQLADTFDFNDTFREEDFEACLEPLETEEVQTAPYPLIPDRKFLE
ncbi:uncharacterized protein N0V89_000024 [Didymosphaeria variabile]|uniref:Uncharacterized protein n=1 Tax=Didymosphaeria variabile TaxID=1932322 RepID=A0A9W8XVB9_9PLEO|nr:uncharacterized protein N0V89_000024 [Didymosphaeria variabile]KAJ4359470.1 hypothetical protein N0V89_000024 [Didymosphaeria variabile]